MAIFDIPDLFSFVMGTSHRRYDMRRGSNCCIHGKSRVYSSGSDICVVKEDSSSLRKDRKKLLALRIWSCAANMRTPSIAFVEETVYLFKMTDLHWLTQEDKCPTKAGEDARRDSTEETLYSEGKDQLECPQTGNQVGRYELERSGQSCEGQHSRYR